LVTQGGWQPDQTNSPPGTLWRMLGVRSRIVRVSHQLPNPSDI
jgi:hypothetical protein